MTSEDIRKYLAITINMGLNKRKNMQTYWRRAYPSQDMPFFRKVLSYNRYILIHRFFHLNNNANAIPRGEVGFDPWHKLRPILDHLNNSFKKYFKPSQLVSIDESMVGMKNRHVYIQYVPNKRHNRFGIKKFELCDSSTGYVYHIELYAGKDFQVRGDDGQAVAVVMHLMEKSNLLGKGYHLLTDNFYTNILLAQKLWDKQTILTGTVRHNSKQFPKDFSNRLQPQNCEYKMSGEILACAFRDKATQKRNVQLLSTGSVPVNYVYEVRGNQRMKPAMVLTYNAGMGGVDLSDRKIYQIASERPVLRYWIKIFRNLLDMALRNSYELYRASTNARNLISCQDFVARIVEGWCDYYVPYPHPAGMGPAQRPAVGCQIEQLEGKKERDCIICSSRRGGVRRRTRTRCARCDVGVHNKCFVEHTNQAVGHD